MIGDYTDFGFMQGELKKGSEVVLIIRRDNENFAKPKHDLLTFTEVGPDFSKLYIYNAVLNSKKNSGGML